MHQHQWSAFLAFREAFRAVCLEWESNSDWLSPLARGAAVNDATPEYPLETPVVYNRALDDITAGDTISLIVIGDNPGKDEQLIKNRRYLVGQAGKLGEGFFRNNPELGIDFRSNVLILNKTPIHTAKTKQLSYMARLGGTRFASFFNETQNWMARETAKLHTGLGCGLWLVGYSELKPSGLFSEYAATLSACYAGIPPLAPEKQVLVFQHFSMNRFSIDLKAHFDAQRSLSENLIELGTAHRSELLGW